MVRSGFTTSKLLLEQFFPDSGWVYTVFDLSISLSDRISRNTYSSLIVILR